MHATLLPSPPLEWQAGATEPRACQGSVLPTELHSQPVLQVCGGGVLLAAPASLEGNLCLSLPSVGPPCPWLACVFWTLTTLSTSAQPNRPSDVPVPNSVQNDRGAPKGGVSPGPSPIPWAT